MSEENLNPKASKIFNSLNRSDSSVMGTMHGANWNGGRSNSTSVFNTTGRATAASMTKGRMMSIDDMERMSKSNINRTIARQRAVENYANTRGRSLSLDSADVVAESNPNPHHVPPSAVPQADMYGEEEYVPPENSGNIMSYTKSTHKTQLANGKVAIRVTRSLSMNHMATEVVEPDSENEASSVEVPAPMADMENEGIIMQSEGE